MVRSTCLILDL